MMIGDVLVSLENGGFDGDLMRLVEGL